MGAECGKKDKLLYKAKTADEAIERGEWHLADEAKHSNPKLKPEEVKAKALEGLSEGFYEEWYVIDDKGQEQPMPALAQVVANQPLEKDSGDTFRFRDRSRRQQSRSRSPRSANAQPHRSSGARVVAVSIRKERPPSDPPANAIVKAAPFATPQTLPSFQRSPIELDSMIDTIETNATACVHLAHIFNSSVPMFEQAAKAMSSCTSFFFLKVQRS